ncbi:uncharacterized protein LOC131021536 [Salvia miltiorrhiza]|uniref:uncharacterized protein LOC131021536 n=1 Tax=Salvia miltiorrhiza TaxID=226208 RepID=UPI0025AC73E9|nr:uncharacterized protein LOC131021536 [Salvia miltiorrhiza]
MPGDRHCRRIDTIELKLQIEMRLGRQKTEQYFNLLNRYLSLKISKSDFDKLCINLLGRESVTLHNRLIRAIIRNAHLSKSPPPKCGKGKASLNVKVPNKYQWFGRDSVHESPTNGRIPTPWDCKSKDRTSPLGPYGKPHSVPSEDSLLKVQEQHSATELLSLGSRPPVEVTSVEEGEEIEQLAGSPGTHSRSPLSAPFGVSLNKKGTREMLSHGSSQSVGVETCYNNGELPDTSSLRKRLKQALEMEGLNVSTDSANLLNSGLDIFMKRLLKPCLNLASSRSESKVSNKVYHVARSSTNGIRPLTVVQNSNQSFSVSMADFQVAMQSNSQILGEDWPILLEKMLCATEEYLSG